ncbi:hypothetical protein M408DRAFT_176327 [Serendipita vermifera MAFF 305830]|uniref:Uncharacterized protein n=1 Tax=Serendipita vermifera MAFF 305830 TaxID=933852 RepID=A0A0C3B476_SERVB|nr:hypothetical protein M408DRAFT_176327 [Serendipita vermifera MAFF 305830]
MASFYLPSYTLKKSYFTSTGSTGSAFYSIAAKRPGRRSNLPPHSHRESRAQPQKTQIKVFKDVENQQDSM